MSTVRTEAKEYGRQQDLLFGRELVINVKGSGGQHEDDNWARISFDN